MSRKGTLSVKPLSHPSADSVSAIDYGAARLGRGVRRGVRRGGRPGVDGTPDLVPETLVPRSLPSQIDFQGLMMDLPSFQLRYQTLKANYGQSAFQDNSNNREHCSDTLFYYRVLVPTFLCIIRPCKSFMVKVHLKTISVRPNTAMIRFFYCGIPLFTFWLHHQTLKANYD
ncbi:hypothetical protein EVAR_45398_1 [Eumeta japonica]|uniref:Uncharacterized protein n=1 Tax=Eumeta variegata TaxID=151549 RepID=A0A4C1WTT3_EUMVA|nr:hypothetical protein EVAR_45398_1 [Eumeta japonica]